MYLLGAFSPGPLEFGVILIVVLIIFGPKQLPKLGKMFGQTMKEVRAGVEEANQGLAEVNDAVSGQTAAAAAVPAEAPAVAPAPAATEAPAAPAEVTETPAVPTEEVQAN